MKASFLSFLAVPALMPVDALQQRQSNWTVGQTVQTSSGAVHGHAALNATQVSEYLGVPFAAPPVGDLRFAAPQKYSGNSTINGTSFVSQCLSPETFRGAITELKDRDFLAPPLRSQ
jgi:cholinesterase